MKSAITTSSRKRKKNLSLTIAIPCILAVGGLIYLSMIGQNSKPSSKASSENKNIEIVSNLNWRTESLTTNLSTNIRITSENLDREDCVGGVSSEANPQTNRIFGVSPEVSSEYAFIKSESDRIIVQIMQVTDASGGMAPIPIDPSPDGGNAEFLNSLTNEIVIAESDSAKIRELKQNVINTRAQIKEIIDNGGTFQEAIQEYRSFVNENASIRVNAILKYQELKKTDPEAAEEFVKIVNEEFEAQGITPINTSSQLKESLKEKFRAKMKER